MGTPVTLVNSSEQEVVLGGSGASAGQVQGNAASGAAPAGNPVRVAGVFNTTPPTLTNGQQGDLQVTSLGYAIVQLNGGSAQIVGSGQSAQTIVATATVNSIRAVNFNYLWNGTAWAQSCYPNAAARIPSSAATTNATSAKASAGNVFRVSGHNANAAVRYLKLYNKASAPTVGTDTPALTIALPATQSFSFDFAGHWFATGIAFALTTGAADADTGAVGAGDILGLNVTYA